MFLLYQHHTLDLRQESQENILKSREKKHVKHDKSHATSWKIYKSTDHCPFSFYSPKINWCAFAFMLWESSNTYLNSWLVCHFFLRILNLNFRQKGQKIIWKRNMNFYLIFTSIEGHWPFKNFLQIVVDFTEYSFELVEIFSNYIFRWKIVMAWYSTHTENFDWANENFVLLEHSFIVLLLEFFRDSNIRRFTTVQQLYVIS